MNRKQQQILLLSLVVVLNSFTTKAQKCFGSLKATFTAHTDRTYFFTKDKYYRYNTHGDRLENNGQSLSNWKGLPMDFDAAVYNPNNGYYYFFKGDTYYKYDFTKGVIGRPYKLGVEGWREVPANIDAAVQDAKDPNIVHFFKGDETFIYSHKYGDAKFSSSFEKRWPGLPSNIDAALLHKNGNYYFFKGNNYYRFSPIKKRVDKIGTIGKDGWRGLCFSKSKSAIQSIKDKVTKIPETPPKTFPNHKSGFDAVTFNTTHKDVHFFNAKKVFNIKYKKPYPELLTYSYEIIESYWKTPDASANIGSLGTSWYKGAPRPIDAVMNLYEKGKTHYYFFLGDKYYTWFDGAKQSWVGYITKKFKGIPDKIDAAVHVKNREGNYIYFFKGDRYYKYDITSNHLKKWSFIKSDFKGVPIPVDAARYIQSPENTIVFYSGTNYYYFNLNFNKIQNKGAIPSKYLKIK